MPQKKSDTSPSELDVQEKQAFPLTARLNNLITDSTALRKHLDCTTQTISQYRTGTSRPSLENLCKIADFYGVSTDYLLGRAQNKTTDPKIQEVIEFTGLDETAVSFLQEAKGSAIYSGTIALLNVLLENREQFIQLCSAMLEYADMAPTTVIINRKYGEENRATKTYQGDSADPLLKYVAQEMFSEVLDFLKKHNREVLNDGKH